MTSTLHDPARVQRRTLSVLIAAQILGGLGNGSVLSSGALLATSVSGDPAWSGAAATSLTLGTALAAVPLAAIADRVGRRRALATGSSVAVVGAFLIIWSASASVFPMLLLSMVLVGAGNAAGLQARFSATDLAAPERRGRDLSLVVWCTTIGAVAGPNLLGPGGALAETIGLPMLTGPFLFTIAAQVAATVLYLVGLRPDPLLLSRSIAPVAVRASADLPRRGRLPGAAVFAIAVTATSHAVMVGVMAMTPVHLTEHGVALALVGVTISLHIAGMYGLSPLFGQLVDRRGAVPTVLIGQLLLGIGVAITALGAETPVVVAIGLCVIGLGWSGSTVAGAALLTDAVPAALRPRAQGRSDLTMNLAGAAAGAAAGPVLAGIGYAGLAAVAGGLVLAALAGTGFRLGRRPA